MDTRSTRRSWLLGAAASAAVIPPGAPLRLPRKVRIGLIGLDGHYGEITDHLSEAPGAELVAISDAPPNRRWNVRWYPGYREMLDREKLDIAAVCNINGEHANAIVACAERKVHVISEKPLATELEDLERVKTAVTKSGIKLTTLLTMRWEPAYYTMKRVMQTGAVGEVAQIASQKSYKLGERPAWYRKRSTFGGAIPWIGIHMLDLMRWTSGREFTEAFSYQARIGHPEMGDMENVTGSLFRLDNGGIAELRMDYLRPETASTHGDDRLRLTGTKGVLEYQQATGVTLIAASKRPERIPEIKPERSFFAEFIASLYVGGESPLLLQDIYRTNEIVLLARRSADEHRIERL